METVRPTYEDLLAEILALKAVILAQSSLITEQSLRLSELEKRLNKTSANSSQPSSSNGFKKVVQNNREKGVKKSGGQPAHEGSTLLFADISSVAEFVPLSVEGVCVCGLDLSVSGELLPVERRQVWDLPVLLPHITEYQLERKRCSCGLLHKAVCKSAPHSIQYGSRVKAFCTYGTVHQLLPLARMKEFLGDIFGFPQLSEGVILDSNTLCYERLSDWETSQVEALRDSKVLHVDETGFEVEGKRQWGHVSSTPLLTLYQYHPKRGKEAHEANGILPSYKGLLVHDRYSSYTSYDCTHSLCNAHLLRNLKSVREDGQQWAAQMYVLLNEAHQKKIAVSALETRYKEILETGFEANPIPEKTGNKGKTAQTESLNLLQCFRENQADILRFFYQEDAPFDNNLAERDLRMFKLKQKVSGTFRTSVGAKIFCRIRSLISTLRKQGRNVWENLCDICSTPQQYTMPTDA